MIRLATSGYRWCQGEDSKVGKSLGLSKGGERWDWGEDGVGWRRRASEGRGNLGPGGPLPGLGPCQLVALGPCGSVAVELGMLASSWPKRVLSFHPQFWEGGGDSRDHLCFSHAYRVLFSGKRFTVSGFSSVLLVFFPSWNKRINPYLNNAVLYIILRELP